MLIQGNALRLPFRDKSVHCAVTSPPYYGLRDYQIAGQLGLEPTLQEYIDNTVLWAREVRRVLRDDGTLWLNLGDSYNSGSGGYNDKYKGGFVGREDIKGKVLKSNKTEKSLKPKDLMMVPHRVAIALQNDGWWVRSDICWAKPNPMPESVTDRPTKSHEYIFLLTKSKKYYYDTDAIRESHTESTIKRIEHGLKHRHPDNVGVGIPPVDTERMGERFANPAGRNKRSVWEYYEDEFLQFLEWKRNQKSEKPDVWRITTKPYPGAHFATFPPEIPEICIKAGTSEKGVCPVCGNPWVRETDVSYVENTRTGGSSNSWKIGNSDGMSDIKIKKMDKVVETIGWKATCTHSEQPIPAVVLDPFAGSGTTVAVANALGRKGIGVDLSWDYLQLARERTGAKALDEWIGGRKVESNMEDLPLFEGVDS